MQQENTMNGKQLWTVVFGVILTAIFAAIMINVGEIWGLKSDTAKAGIGGVACLAMVFGFIVPRWKKEAAGA